MLNGHSSDYLLVLSVRVQPMTREAFQQAARFFVEVVEQIPEDR
jgi:hypothetical protein